MPFSLNNNGPTDGDAVVAAPIRLNFQSIAQALQALDGTALNAGSVGEAALATGINPRLRWGETGMSFVATGLQTAGFAGLGMTIPSGVAYINGYRVVSAGQAFTVAINNDTYIDLDQNGVFHASAVATNVASPAVFANSIRLAIVVSNGSAITSINYGQTTAVAPIIASNVIAVCDSLGNRIYPTSPSNGLIAYRRDIITHVGVANPYTVPGITLPVIVPAGRQIRLVGACPSAEFGSSTASISTVQALESATVVAGGNGFLTGLANTNASYPTLDQPLTPTAGLHTYTMSASIAAGTGQTVDGSAPGLPAYLAAYLI